MRRCPAGPDVSRKNIYLFLRNLFKFVVYLAALGVEHGEVGDAEHLQVLY